MFDPKARSVSIPWPVLDVEGTPVANVPPAVHQDRARRLLRPRSLGLVRSVASLELERRNGMHKWGLSFTSDSSLS